MTKKKYDDPPKSVPFGGKEHLEWGQVALFEQTNLLQKVHDKIIDPKNHKAMIMAISLISIHETTRSILILARTSVRDSYALSRIILDAVLNLAYYSIDDKMIDKANKHSHQKSFRDLFRTIDQENLSSISTLPDIEDFKLPQNLQKALDQFTSRKGNEIKNWYGEPRDSVFKKIEKIEAEFGEGMGKILNLCVFSIYRHASEIIHGTLFGTWYGIGFNQTRNEIPKNDKELIEYRIRMNSYLMSTLNLLMVASLEIINKDFPIEKLLKESKSISSQLTKMTTNANNL